MAQTIFGSTITLISKMGVRYEGILYSIDQDAQTVALSNGKSGSRFRMRALFFHARSHMVHCLLLCRACCAAATVFVSRERACEMGCLLCAREAPPQAGVRMRPSYARAHEMRTF